MSFSAVFVIWNSFFLISQSYTTLNWVKPDSFSIPGGSDTDRAVGIYNDTIWILGGYRNSPPMRISYDINSETFSNHPALPITPSPVIWATGSFYTQYEEILYIRQSVGYTTSQSDYINTFNMATNTFTEQTIPKNDTTSTELCLAISPYGRYLYHLAGFSQYLSNYYNTNFRIYDTINAKWSWGPQLPVARGNPSCCVLNNTLYYIGGWFNDGSGTNEHKEIFTLDISDTAAVAAGNGVWNQFPAMLNYGRAGAKCSVYENYLYIVGGDGATKLVERIDVIAGQVYIDNSLIGSVQPDNSVIAAVQYEKLFVFGADIDPLQYSIFKEPTMTPTMNPTKTTVHPTIDPTIEPTIDPTIEPTIEPTSEPTIEPTSEPTTNKPTNNPTKQTRYPSIQPTDDPTKSPTFFENELCNKNDNLYEIHFSFILYFTQKFDHQDLDGFLSQLLQLIMVVFKETVKTVKNVNEWDEIWCVEGEIDVEGNIYNRRILLSTNYNVKGEFTYNEILHLTVFNNDVLLIAFRNQFKIRLQEMINAVYGGNGNDGIPFTEIGNMQIDDPEAITVLNSKPLEWIYIDLTSIVMVCIIFVGCLVLIVGQLHSCKSKADDFKLLAVVLFCIYVWDFFSDLLFAITLWEKNSDLIYMILFILSSIFVVIPLLKNFYDLIQAQSHWQQHEVLADRYRNWLQNFGTILYILSFVSGSSYAALMLLNSNALGLRIFSMGLSRKDLSEFNQKRFINVVLAENLPQLIIEIAFCAISGGLNGITSLAIASSAISICVCILSFISRKKMLNDPNVEEFLFSVKVSSENDIVAEQLTKYQHKIKPIVISIADVLQIEQAAVNILPLRKILSDKRFDGGGLEIYFVVATSKLDGNELYSALIECCTLDKGDITTEFGHTFLGKKLVKAWKMDKTAKIITYDLNWQQKEKKKEFERMINGSKQTEIQMSQQIGEGNTIQS